METPAQGIRRLLTAIESLVAEEEVLFRAGEFQEAGLTQDKLQPLIDRLGELARTPALRGRLDGTLKQRAADILARRGRSAELLSVRLAEVRAQLRVLAEAQQRTARLRPVYGRAVLEQPANALAASA
ncbi:MAG: hypothetical protein HY302_08970 [Opitutae bacterium]|nr:hypothetical protein [Opitutae bacterium]